MFDFYDLMGALATDDADAIDEKRSVEAVKLFIFFQLPLFVLISVLRLLLENGQGIDWKNLFFVFAVEIQFISILP